MKQRKPKPVDDLTGCRVLILVGRNAGREGICTGKSAEGDCWAVSPDGSDEILQLVFEKEFGLLIDRSGNPESN